MKAIGAAVLGIFLATFAARAETWPAHPITLVVPYPPGGTSDNFGRFVADRLGRALGSSVIVENRPGAAGMIGSAYVAHAAPDGYTLLAGNNATHVIQPVVSKSVPYDPRKDFTPVATLMDSDQFLGVSEKLGVGTLAEFVAKVKAAPGTYNYGSAGSGSFGNFCGEFFKIVTGTDMQHVPYKGSGAALLDLIAGRIQAAFDPVVLDQSKNGVKVLAVMSDHRFPGRPDVPTTVEAGYPSLVVAGWFGVLGPAKMPAEITDRIAAAVTAMANDPVTTERANAWGLRVNPRGPRQTADAIASDLKKYREIKQTAHIETVE